MIRRPLFAGAVPVGLAMLLSSCGGTSVDQAETERRPTPVRAVRAEVRPASETFTGSGTLAARAEMELSFNIPGYIQAIEVREGESVRAGQVLARLNPTEAQAQVRSANAQADLASRHLDRMERLFADSVVPEAQVDAARDAHERAQAGLQIATYNRTHTVIRAPAAGRILARRAEVSEFVGPGAAVLRFGSTDSGWVVRVAVPDHQILRIAHDSSARIVFPALQGEALEGRVTEIADGADPRTGTFEVEVALLDGAVPVRSGMVAQVEIGLSDARALIYLPPVAVVDGEGPDGSVFVIDDGTARIRPVRIVSIGADAIAVQAPDLAGRQVVTTGAAFLRDGEPVGVVASF